MREIELTQGYKALVDDEDYERITDTKWQVLVKPGGNKYAYRRKYDSSTKKYLKQMMHRVILNMSPGILEVDHIDTDGLNNQKHNLRICEHKQNARNVKKVNGTSRFKGVSFRTRKSINQWEAQIRVNNKYVHLGCFATDIEAAECYNNAAIKFFGEFARLNIL